MANNFKNWIDTPVAGTNVLSQANFASDTQRANGFKAGDPASAIRVNTGLRQANLVAASLMEAIQVAGVDISSLTHLSTISDVQAKITAGLNAIAKNGLNATTLNGLLSGSNGIAIAKNATGDKVEAKLALPETGPITLKNNNVPRPAISIEVANGGPPAFGGIKISNVSDSNNAVQLGPRQVLVKSGDVELTFDGNGIISRYHGNEVGHGLISGGPKSNVKTLFGNQQSIYGSGNIDLYIHCVKLWAVVNSQTICDCVFVVPSSSNTKIDSLTGLFSVLKPIVGSDSVYPVSGRMYNAGNNKYYTATRIYPTSDGGIISHIPEEEKWFKWSELRTLTFYDNVTAM